MLRATAGLRKSRQASRNHQDQGRSREALQVGVFLLMNHLSPRISLSETNSNQTKPNHKKDLSEQLLSAKRATSRSVPHPFKRNCSTFSSSLSPRLLRNSAETQRTSRVSNDFYLDCFSQFSLIDSRIDSWRHELTGLGTKNLHSCKQQNS